MFDGKTMVESRSLELQFFEDIKGEFNPKITGAMDMDAISRVPELTREPFHDLRRCQPFTMVTIYETGFLELHQLGKKTTVREEFHSIAKLQPVSVSTV